MNSSEFHVDRVESLHNIASATPAAGDKDQKRRRSRNPGQSHDTQEDKAIADAEDGLNIEQEQHVIDFEA
jgi:hypothetical protein